MSESPHITINMTYKSNLNKENKTSVITLLNFFGNGMTILYHVE